MKVVYLPNKCLRCENDVKLEEKQDGTINAYCGHCNFILKFTKEEVESLLK